MATDRYVKSEASINSKRSLFPLHRRTLLSYMHGYLQPVGTPIEILPGDTIKAKLSVFTRMSTPIVPIMDNIRQEIDAFFVPKRILWDKTKQFYGEAPSFGVATPVVEPYITDAILLSELPSNQKKCESIGAAFGIVKNGSTVGDPEINVLPIRAVFACYNEYFRDENYQDPYVWNKSATGLVNATIIATLGGNNITIQSFLPKVNKDRDVVSSLLPYQIKGSPVTLSVGGTAPVGVINGSGNFEAVNITGTNDYESGKTTMWIQNTSGSYLLNGATDGTLGAHMESGTTAGGDLVSNLSSVTSVNVSDLIYAFAYQDFLARAAHFGTRYKEYIYGMFGTRIADATEDIPEYLGRLKLSINVNQVVQTTGFAPSSSSSLGALGAYSNSGNSGELFNKSFTEPGYLVLLSYTKHQRTYSSGIDRVFLKKELLDYYQPPFANIADVPFGSNSIWLDAGSESALGFQEPWWDYKGLLDRVYGMMNPMIDTLGEIWTLAEKWTAKPTIGADFMKEDRDSIARALTTGVNGPDYIMDFQFDAVAARVMPISSRTGLKVM